MTGTMSDEVQAYLDACKPDDRAGLLALRGLILARAAELPKAGRVVEALRWGQPAFLTPETGSGCSLRIGTFRGGGFGLFVHCRTDLIERFRDGPGHGMDTVGTRAVRFDSPAAIRPGPLGFLVGWALVWHLSD